VIACEILAFGRREIHGERSEAGVGSPGASDHEDVRSRDCHQRVIVDESVRIALALLGADAGHPDTLAVGGVDGKQSALAVGYIGNSADINRGTAAHAAVNACGAIGQIIWPARWHFDPADIAVRVVLHENALLSLQVYVGGAETRTARNEQGKGDVACRIGYQ